MYNKFFKPLLTMIIITIICGTAIGLVYNFTKTDAAQIDGVSLSNMIGDTNNTAKFYNFTLQNLSNTNDISSVIISKSSESNFNNIIIISARAKGYSNTKIEIRFAFKENSIIAVEELDVTGQSYWSRIENANMLSSLIGEIKTYSASVDGVTGATSTSTAVANCANYASICYTNNKEAILNAEVE